MWATEDLERCERRTRRCVECGKAVPKDRRRPECSACLDLAADAERMSAGEWVPVGGVLQFVPAACSDCGSPHGLRPLSLLTDPSARWLCADVDACVRRTVQAAYWLTRQARRVAA